MLGASAITPHPESDEMTSEELRLAIAEAEEKMKFAQDHGDKVNSAWFIQELRQLEAALARRNGHTNYGNDGEETKKKRKSQADVLVEIVNDSGAELFHSASGETFVSFAVKNHTETWPTNSQATRQWLRHLYYVATAKAPNTEALQTTLGLLESQARFDGKTIEVSLRTAWQQGALFYDLCDPEWRVVRVDHDGWQILDRSPIKFLRYAHMAPQVLPRPGGNLDELFNFINVKEPSSRDLIKAFLPVALIPDIPRPCLALHGDQGSGKTSTGRKLRALIDPSNMPMLRCKDDAETVQGLAHHYCPIIDNLSSLPVWLSDTLSRAVTGEGFTKRALYTNSEDVLFKYKRVLILTGIGLVITKPDLLDRSIIVGLGRIADDARRDEQGLDSQFGAVRPFLFGAMLDLLAGGLGAFPKVRAQRLPRMADFMKWAMAVQIGQGRDPGLFTASFETNVERQNEEALAASGVATVLVAFLSDTTTGWCGQPHELFALLKERACAMSITGKSFPGNPAAMGRRLREIRPNLISLGWSLEFRDNDRPRTISATRLNRENAVRADGQSDSTVSNVGNFLDPWDAGGLA